MLQLIVCTTLPFTYYNNIYYLVCVNEIVLNKLESVNESQTHVFDLAVSIMVIEIECYFYHWKQYGIFETTSKTYWIHGKNYYNLLFYHILKKCMYWANNNIN